MQGSAIRIRIGSSNPAILQLQESAYGFPSRISSVTVFPSFSPAVAASALLGMSDKLSTDELDSLEAMIAKARSAKGAK